MAIYKRAKNMTIMVKADYNVNVGGKLEKVTSKFNVESRDSDLKLMSNKKIVSDGNKQ